MQNNLIDKKIVDQKLAACGISDMEDATIRDIVKVVNMVEAESGEKFIRMEMGVPGLAPSKIGIDAEIEALRAGCAQFYPMPKATRNSRKKVQVREELRGHRHQAGRYHPDRGFHAGLFRRLHGSNGM